MKKKDSFYIKRILKYFTLLVLMLAVIYIGVILGINLWKNSHLQLVIVNKIIDNIVVIIVSAFYILGINLLYKK